MKPLRIAVCDDEQAECELMEKYIREWAACRAYQALVLSFSGGEALLQAFFQKGFDLVLLDIQMQGTDGMSAARRIRAADPDAGIFFVTGYEDYLAEGYEVEAFRYLLKPLRREKLWEALDLFLASYMEGCEVVYGVRNDRHSDGFFKKATATAYYRLMHLLGSRVITNHADYRLLSRKALNALAEYGETNLFLRGLIPTMGFTSNVVYFDVKAREAGHSKYTLNKMLTLAVDGITSMSIRPIRLISGLGFLVFLFSVIMCVIGLVDWARGNNVPGYTTTLCVTLMLGGVTLLSLGIIGEYVGKIYMETKHRPRYIIDTLVWREGEEEEEKEC